MALTPVTNVVWHEPSQPSWECISCPDGTAWPCEPYRAELLSTYQIIDVHLLMSPYFLWACGDLGAEPAGALHRRFLGWITEGPRR